MWSVLRTLVMVFLHAFRKKRTVQYPEQRRPRPARARGRIILAVDEKGRDRCVACYLCAAVCPVDCIALEAEQDQTGRRRPKSFRINFSRCIFCGFCEEACPTCAIQLTPDFEMGEYDRRELVYEKPDLTISGPGKYPGYDFYRVAGVATEDKDHGQGPNERPPADVKGLLP